MQKQSGFKVSAAVALGCTAVLLTWDVEFGKLGVLLLGSLIHNGIHATFQTAGRTFILAFYLGFPGWILQVTSLKKKDDVSRRVFQTRLGICYPKAISATAAGGFVVFGCRSEQGLKRLRKNSWWRSFERARIDSCHKCRNCSLAKPLRDGVLIYGIHCRTFPQPVNSLGLAGGFRHHFLDQRQNRN
ncbi:hypothetical protein [Acidipila rosea]|uniref:Uncharacterized protein n=1 Tax=Acidipila rosea TaxID=768535 RepID=A0A4R1LCI7_9BACT|nr:hypothetical protein [Acidipila rosea]TCK75904.1 hypothetical protein C7378_0904 [Acidipila rosea]